MPIWGKGLQSTKKEVRPKNISDYFIGYVERSKEYKFYCPSHNTKFVKSRNGKFLENNLISESDSSSILSDGLIELCDTL